MSALGILLLIWAILCVGMCAYGITTAACRSKDHRDQDAHAPTRR
jgi:sulfite exporter TauE/SafE